MENLGLINIFITPNVLSLSILTAGIFSVIAYFMIDKEKILFLKASLIDPGLRNSKYHLSGGEESGIFYDMDVVTSSAIKIRDISDWYVSNIKDLQSKINVDSLAFIEREDGPVGAITEKDLISYRTETDAFVVRPRKRIKVAMIKDSDKLISKNVVLLNDVTTTGYSVMKAIDIIENRGAKVIATLSIVNRGGEDTREFFKHKGIDFRYAGDLTNGPPREVAA